MCRTSLLTSSVLQVLFGLDLVLQRQLRSSVQSYLWLRQNNTKGLQTSNRTCDGSWSTLLKEKGTQGISGLLAAWLLLTTLAVLLVGLFFTLSRRLRKRLRARQDAGTVQAVNVDRDAWTCGRFGCCCCCCCCCCRCSSMACCLWSGCRWAMDSCRLMLTRGSFFSAPFMASEVSSCRG